MSLSAQVRLTKKTCCPDRRLLPQRHPSSRALRSCGEREPVSLLAQGPAGVSRRPKIARRSRARSDPWDTPGRRGEFQLEPSHAVPPLFLILVPEWGTYEVVLTYNPNLGARSGPSTPFGVVFSFGVLLFAAIVLFVSFGSGRGLRRFSLAHAFDHAREVRSLSTI